MRTYLLIMALSCAAVCGAAALFNYQVDPYGIYAGPRPDREHLSRINQLNHMRLTKPWHLEQTRPTAVVIGTSRSGSVPPRHPGWTSSEAYNLSLPGLTPYELGRFIEHAQASGPLRHLMIGLDFEALALPEPLYRPGFDDDRLALPGELRPRAARRFQRMQDIADTLFSLPAAGLSLAAWAGHGDTGRWYYPDGTWDKRSRFLTGRGGYLYMARGIMDIHRSGRVELGPNLAYLQQALEYCYQNGIDTRLYFTPTHVFMTDLWYRLGYGPVWAESHRAVIEANRVLAALHDREPFPVWGFGDIAGVVDEPVVQGRNREAYWYDDGVHFSQRLGERIMDAVWGAPDTFGTRLDERSLQPYLQRTLQLARQFEQDNRELTAGLRRDIGAPP